MLTPPVQHPEVNTTTSSITFYKCENSAPNRATAELARQHLDAVKDVVNGDGEWSIWGLANGMKISGAGYGYGIEFGDSYAFSICAADKSSTTTGRVFRFESFLM